MATEHVDSPPADTVLTVKPEPVEPPPELPVLPDPTSQHDVLRVTGDKGPKTVTNRFGKTKVQWTPLQMLKPRKILEICTWTMLITTTALEKSDKWKACTPVSIEHGYDLLTGHVRRKAEQYIHKEKPDLIVGE